MMLLSVLLPLRYLPAIVETEKGAFILLRNFGASGPNSSSILFKMSVLTA